MIGRSVIAMLLVGVAPLAAAQAKVTVTSSSRCVDPHAMTRELDALLGDLAGTRRSALEVRVVADATSEGTALMLEARDARGAGELRRDFIVKAADCDSVFDLLAVMLTQHVRSLPVEAWTEMPEPSAAPPRSLGLAVRIAPMLAGPTARAALDLTAGAVIPLAAGEVSAGLVAIVPYNPRLEGGRPFTALTLIELGWHWRANVWRFGGGLRSGALIAAGTGYEDNRKRAVLWSEVVADVSRVWSSVEVGVLASYAPIRHALVTTTGERQSVAYWRVGPAISFVW